MKKISSFIIVLLTTVTIRAQTYALTGTITGTPGNVGIGVFEFNKYTGNWRLARTYKPAKSFNLELNQDTDYQIWFISEQGTIKILAVNRETITEDYPINISFKYPESAQIIRDERGNYALILIDTDFNVLRTPLGF